jgi:soluble lytic murein transglycosylase-like protein
MTPLTTYQTQCLGWINEVLTAYPSFAWLDPSYVMASIRIESGFDPTVVNATGRQDGLMQVIPSTAAQMGETGPQTDPLTSIRTGMKYLDFCMRDIISKWNAEYGNITSVALSAVIEAYNEGQAAVEAGKRDDAYWTKWAAAQTILAAQIMAVEMLAGKIAPSVTMIKA